MTFCYLCVLTTNAFLLDEKRIGSKTQIKLILLGIEIQLYDFRPYTIIYKHL